ncbi:hypothetical protein Tco_0518159 [Tanacetum coccineum]
MVAENTKKTPQESASVQPEQKRATPKKPTTTTPVKTIQASSSSDKGNLPSVSFHKKVRKGKPSFQLVDEDDEAQQESIPHEEGNDPDLERAKKMSLEALQEKREGEGDDADLERAIKLSLDPAFLPQGRAPVGGVTIRDPFILVRRGSNTSTDSTTGPLLKPEDDTIQMIAPFTDVTSSKPSLLVTPPPINTEATNNPPHLIPEIILFIALQLKSGKIGAKDVEVKLLITLHTADLSRNTLCCQPRVVLDSVKRRSQMQISVCSCIQRKAKSFCPRTDKGLVFTQESTCGIRTGNQNSVGDLQLGIEVAVSSSLRLLEPTHIESRPRRIRQLISLGHNIRVKRWLFTMKMEILLEPTSNKRSSYERPHKGVKASANSDIMYFFTSTQDGDPLQDDVRLCLGDDLKKAQDHILDTAYQGFLGVGTTFDIFQNILFPYGLNTAYWSFLDTAYWILFPSWSLVSAAQIRRIFLDGYGVLVVRIVIFKYLCLSSRMLCSERIRLHVDDKLRFVEEPVEIMDREVKRLKQSRIPLVKVRWNSRRGLEFTWEREDQFQKKYPHLFTKPVPSSSIAT